MSQSSSARRRLTKVSVQYFGNSTYYRKYLHNKRSKFCMYYTIIQQQYTIISHETVRTLSYSCYYPTILCTVRVTEVAQDSRPV